MKKAQTKQRKMGKSLLRALKKDPPSTVKKSLVSWSDTLTLKFLKELKKNPHPKVENQVEQYSKFKLKIKVCS
jgi:hypothetical protein